MQECKDSVVNNHTSSGGKWRTQCILKNTNKEIVITNIWEGEMANEGKVP